MIYLASQSPRRSQLLDQLGIAHHVLVADAAEDAESLEAERAGESPEAYVQRVTAAKLAAAVLRRVRRGLPDAPVLCADTTVALGSRIFGKPDGEAGARAMLQALSGQAHRVLTAVAVEHGGRRHAALSTSEVTFAPLTDTDIAAYVATGEPFGKAGGYGIQGQAAAFIAHIAGSYSGIMGLPLYETAALLRAASHRP